MDEWKEQPLGQCLDPFHVPNKIKKRQFASLGEFPIISQGEDFINGYWNNNQDVCKLDRPVVVFGDHTQVVKYVDFDFVVGADGVKILKPKTFLEPKFLYYYIQGNRAPSQGYARHYRHIKQLIVRIPPQEDQRRIVAVLDEAFEGLDRARANAEANLRDASELFDNYLSLVFLADAQNWPTVTLPEIAQNLDRVRVPITKKDRTSGDVPYYGASGVVDYVADFLFNEDLLLVSEDGANLLARSYPIAFSISGKAWVNNHAHVLRFEDSFTQEYIQHYLNSISLAPYVRGMAQPKLNQASLNRIPIPFPSESGRAKIVGRADLVSAETQHLAEAYQASLKDLDDLRQSILQRAFAGELT